jgi:hypothetical protein
MATVVDVSGNSPANGVEDHIPTPSEMKLNIVDGVDAPDTATGYAQLYVDAADGDLKVKFGDGTTKVISADT